MKRVVTIFGCVVGVLCILGLGLVLAEEPEATPEADSQIQLSLTEDPFVITPETAIPTQISIIPEPTLEVTAPVEVITAPISEVTTEPNPITTQEVIVLPVSDLTVTVAPSQTPVPTLASTQALWSISGQARYPNRKLGQAFIRVQSFAPDGTLLSTSFTDANGLYALVGLADQVTRVEIDAPLHLTETLYVVPQITPIPLTLRAGDLDGDACIGKKDIDLLTTHYGETFAGADLDGSAIVDIVDLALLSSNYDETCVAPEATEAAPIATEEAVITATEEPTPGEATQEATLEVTMPLPTQEAIPVEPAVAPIVTEEAVPVATATETPLPIEATLEPTVEPAQQAS